MSTRSHNTGPTARTTPSLDPGRASRCTHGLREIVEDLHTLAESMMLGTYNNLSPTEAAHLLAKIDDLVQQATGALVVRQRSQGKSLTGIAAALDRSEDRLRKKYPPDDVDCQLASRKRPVRTKQTGKNPVTLSLQPEWRLPHQRVAAALTRIVNEHGVSQRQIATLLRVDPSYVSRMLSGEREASWPYVKAICDACDVGNELLKPLWEVAAGVPPNTDEPVRYLRAYLHALHFAAGSPREETVLASAPSLPDHQLRQALDGPGVPDWSVIAQVVTALKGLPETARPVWMQARSCEETGPAPAEPFG